MNYYTLSRFCWWLQALVMFNPGLRVINYPILSDCLGFFSGFLCFTCFIRVFLDVHHVWDALIFMKLAVETCWNQHVPTILGGSYRVKPSQTLTSGVQGDRRWKHCPFGPRSERAFGGKKMAQGRGPRVWSLQHDQHSARIYRILVGFTWMFQGWNFPFF